MSINRKAKPLDERLALLRAPQTRKLAFLTFFALVALTGGGARSDIVSLIFLRPMAVLMGTYALLAMPPGALVPFRKWLWLLLATAVVIAWQLVPLPPSIWQALPGRHGVAELDTLLGFGDLWRPSSLAPAATWNALVSLVVPSAALLLYAALDDGDRHVLIPAIVVMAVFSATLGLLQLSAGPDSALYFYRITNGGLPVGLFSNRNHQAIFLAAALPALAFCLRYSNAGGAGWTKSAAVTLGLLLMIGVLLTGSRAGLVVVGPALAAAVIVLGGTFSKKPPSVARGRRWLGPVAIIGGILIVGGVVVAAGGKAIERIWSTDLDEEKRLQALGPIIDLVETVWTTGAGAGTFTLAYQRVEPTQLIGPQYLNHAHNDYLELLIELGLPGMALLMVFAGLLVLTMLSRTREMVGAGQSRAAVAMWVIPLIFAAASITDYPLRTPSLAMVFFLFSVALGDRQSMAYVERATRRSPQAAPAPPRRV